MFLLFLHYQTSDRVGLEGKELDLYNDKLKIAIEYDGEYSHTKNKDDEGKNKIVEKLGIKLYRFREPGCSGVSGRNYILEDSRFMSASLECCLKSFVRDVLKKDDKFINFEKDKRTIKEYVSNNKRATIHLYEKKKMNNGMVAEIIKMSTVIITKNKAKSIVDCLVWIPRSAFLNTMRHNKTTTPTMLFSFPNKMLKILTKKKQNANVTAIFTRYTHI